MPQCHLSLPVRGKPPLESHPSLLALARAAEEAEASRVLLRYSGTEPVLRILVEAERREDAQVWMDRLAAEVARLGLLP
jgi:phosphoglucosamine mutase